MDLGLGGRVAVVVGAARGLGRAIATAFAAEGAHVALLDVSPDVPAAAAALARDGVTTAGHVADVTDFAAVRAAHDAVRSQFGRVDHVVFAAAVGSGKFGFPFWKLDPADWPRVLAVNLLGAVNVAHAFAPGWPRPGRGRSCSWRRWPARSGPRPTRRTARRRPG